MKSPTWNGLRPTSDRLRETLFNVLAPRVAGDGVTVNSLAPALVCATKMFPADLETGVPPVPIPVGRVGRPDEMADMAVAMLRN